MNPLAIEAITKHQRQLDIDGVEVGVSRQALDELLEAYNVVLSANEFLRNARDSMEKRWIEAARQRNVLADALNEIAALDRQNLPPHGGSIAMIAARIVDYDPTTQPYDEPFRHVDKCP